MKIVAIILAIYVINILCGISQIIASKLWNVRVEKATIGVVGLTKNKMTLGLIPIGNQITLNKDDVVNHPKQEMMLLTKQLSPYILCAILFVISLFLTKIEYFKYIWLASLFCLFIRLVPTANSEMNGLMFLFSKLTKHEKPITEQEVEIIDEPEKEKTKLDEFVNPKLRIFRMTERKRIIKELKKQGIGYFQRTISAFAGIDDVEAELNKRTEIKRQELIEKFYKYNYSNSKNNNSEQKSL